MEKFKAKEGVRNDGEQTLSLEGAFVRGSDQPVFWFVFGENKLGPKVEQCR